MPRVRSVSVSILLTLLIFGNIITNIPLISAEEETSNVSGMVKELVFDDNKELYIEKIISTEIKDTELKKIAVNLVCKNLFNEPESCVDIFFFSLADTSGKEYQPRLTESKILAARIPTRDVVQGTLTFVIPKAQNATQLIYTETEGSNFLVDVSSTKDPADKAPTSEWKLARNKGLTLSDSNIELKIYDETQVNDYYVLDVSIKNIGSGIVNYHALYAYLKSASGFVYGAELYADIESKIESGSLENGQRARGKLAFDTNNESGPFMLIYDDIAGSYFATGRLVPQVPSGVSGKIIGAEDLVKINQHKSYWDPSSNTYKIVGEVSNNSEKPVSEIQIRATLRDQSKEVIANRNYTLTNHLSSTPVRLVPNASMPFFLEFSIASNVADSIRYYELSLTYSLSEPKAAALQISSAELVQVSKPTPLSKYVLWQIKGQMVNIGDQRSTHTRITASLYDSSGSIIGVGGFSVLDEQPRELNQGQSKSFSIEIALPTASRPASFYLYAESDQFVSIELKKEDVADTKVEEPETLPAQSENHTLIKVMSKQREDVLRFDIKNLPNSTSIYGIQISVSDADIQVLKNKLRWESEEIAGNELLLSTINNSIRAGQQAKFLFSANNDVHVIVWKLLDLNGKVVLEGEVKPFQIKRE